MFLPHKTPKKAQKTAIFGVFVKKRDGKGRKYQKMTYLRLDQKTHLTGIRNRNRKTQSIKQTELFIQQWIEQKIFSK